MTTKEFLSYFPHFVVQTFDDNEHGEKDTSLIKCHKPSEFTSEEIKNLNKKGAGIYFSVNQFPNGVRKKVECKGVNAWIVEIDDIPLAEQYSRFADSPLPPTFLVESKKSVHAYWLAKEASIENYTKIVKGLIKHFGGDESCKDISRVLRVPGFYHMKDRNTPKLVEITHTAPNLAYTDEQMMGAYPFLDEIKKYTPKTAIKTNNFWDFIGNLDNRLMLVRMSGFPIINNEIIGFTKRTTGGEYITINGKMCDAWLDEQGMIGSGKQGGPTWIQWLEFYGRTKVEIARWAKENIPEVEQWVRENEKKQQVVHQITPKKDYRLRYTWGTKGLDNNIAIIKRGNFIVLGAKRNSGKTTFTFDMAKKNANLGHKVLYISLEMDEDAIINGLARKYAGITIPEERDYRIPEKKKKAYDRKIKEIKSVTNLHFKGIRRGDHVNWEAVVNVIGSTTWDLIYIDNLDLIQGENGESNTQRQKRIIQSILSFTSQTKIPIILIHHHRKSQHKTDFGSDELAGSGKIGDGADIIIKIARNSDETAIYPENCRSMIHVQKSRGYDECSLPIYFIKGTFLDDPFENVITMPVDQIIDQLDEI